MKIHFIVLSFSTLIFAQEDLNKVTEEEKQKVTFPPCGACSSLVNSFIAKSKDQTDFDKVKSKTCNDVARGNAQCLQNKDKWSAHLKEWFREPNQSRSDLKEWLCIQKLKVCCPENHFGPECTPCSKIGMLMFCFAMKLTFQFIV